MAYKVLDIYKDLPRINCGKCRKPSCFAFASAVYLEGIDLDDCPSLEAGKKAVMKSKLSQASPHADLSGAEKLSEVADALLAKVAEGNLEKTALKCGGKYSPNLPENFDLNLFDYKYRITRDGVVAVEGAPLTIWIKILLLIYATRASGKSESGERTAFRQLPGAISKAKSFDSALEPLIRKFDDDPDKLIMAVEALGGKPVEPGPAHNAYVFTALPRVTLLMQHWRGDDEFPSRISLLPDKAVLEYLDLEALISLVELFCKRLIGEDLSKVSL